MGERVAKVDLHLIEVIDQEHRLGLDIPALVESILTIGQINPITVKKVGEGYRVISGRRRYSALRYIQEEVKPTEQVQALVYIKEIDELHEELITIDENIMRQNLGDIELDEAIYRRKQIYEQLHPDSKKHVSGGKAKAKKGTAPAFTKDAASKLNVSRRTIEKAVSRAARATDAVKKARTQGLLQSKVDLLVTLEPKEQDMLLPHVKKMDLGDSKALIESAHQRGAKAALIYLEGDKRQDPALKPLLRDAERLSDHIKEALREDRVLRGPEKHQEFKGLEELAARLEKFLGRQRAELGYVQAIKRTEDGGRKVIREARA
jgi:ParB family chromosome partitioning protein